MGVLDLDHSPQSRDLIANMTESGAFRLANTYFSEDQLGQALERGDLAAYQREHARIRRRPQLMAELMLMLDRSAPLRRGVIRTLAWHPPLFAGMLAFHTGAAT